ncbi:phage tail protein [Enterococcus asini]|uniref:phage tail protein n=1 Tax=Enterococcus asini TaxID=57732 RepID=UPI0026DC5A51|nr:hypothetical protein [Enterococcus asini]
MANDGSVIIEVDLKTDKARSQYQQFGNEAANELDKTIGNSKAFKNLSEESTAFAKTAALSIGSAAVAFAGFSIKAAGDAAAMNAQFDQVFDGMGTQATKSLDGIAKETSMLPNRLKGSFTQMAAFAKTAGMDTAGALDLSSRATRAAADSAAFYDRSIEDTTESLQSFLKGNFENDAALGISATETTRNAKANDLYGKSFKDLDESQKQLTLLAMVEDGNKLSGALGQAAREGDGLENVFGNMKQSITDLAAAFGAPLLDPFLGVVKKLSGALSTLAEKLRETPALVGVIVGVITTLVVAFGAVYMKAAGFAKIMQALGAIIPVLTSPIFLVIAAIGALVTAFVYFYKTNDQFRSKVDGVIKTLKTFVAPIGDVVKGVQILAKAFKAIVLNDFSTSVSDLHDQFVKLFPESLWKGMTSFAQKVKGVVQGLATLAKGFKAIAFDDWSVSVSALKADFMEVFPESLWDGMTKLALGIRNLINGFKDGSKGIDPFKIAIKVLKSVILGMLGPIGLFIKAFELIAKVIGGGDVSKGIDTIVDSFTSLAEGIQKNGPLIGTSAGKAIEGILTAIAGALPGIIVGGLSIIAAIVSGIAQGLPTLALAASQLIMAFTGAILLLVPQIALSATAIIVAILASLTAGLPQIIVAGGALILALLAGITEQLPLFVESVATLVVTWLTALTEHLPEIVVAGMDLLIAFLDGITQKLPELVAKVGELIVAFLTSLAGQMPSIVSAGADLLINFLNGLASKMPDIVSAALNLIVQFINGLASKAGDVIEAGVNLIVQILEGIANNIDQIVSAGMDIVDAAVEGILKVQDRLFQAAVTLVNGMADNIRNNRGEMSAAGENLLSALVESLPGGALIENGLALVSGLKDGLLQGFEDVKTTVSGWASTIASLKGPISYDKKVLRKNGFALVFGLNQALDEGFSDTKDNVSKWANELSGAIDDSVDADPLSNLINGSILSISDLVRKIPGIQALMDGTMTPELAFDTARVNGVKSANDMQKVRSRTSSSATNQSVVYEFDIPVVVDGREIARATATYTQDELDRLARRTRRTEEGRF